MKSRTRHFDSIPSSLIPGLDASTSSSRNEGLGRRTGARPSTERPVEMISYSTRLFWQLFNWEMFTCCISCCYNSLDESFFKTLEKIWQIVYFYAKKLLLQLKLAVKMKSQHVSSLHFDILTLGHRTVACALPLWSFPSAKMLKRLNSPLVDLPQYAWLNIEIPESLACFIGLSYLKLTAPTWKLMIWRSSGAFDC